MSDHDEIEHQGANDDRLSLGEFAQSQSPSDWAELCSIRIDTDYPFLRSDCDLRDGKVAAPAELPFANPEAANAALRKCELERLVWSKICAAVDRGYWQCSGRPEDQLEWHSFDARILRQAVPNFSAGSLSLLGEVYEDIEFVRIAADAPDEIALEIIGEFCRIHDPRAHKVTDVMAAIEREGQLRMTDGHVRKLMKLAGVDQRWRRGGRRSAQCTACNP